MTAINAMPPSSPVIALPGAGVTASPRSGGAQISAHVTATQQVQKTSGSQPSLQDVQQAVKQANLSLHGSNEAVTFGYEQKLGELVVQVSDKATGQLIQQLPSKDFIQFQLHMRKMIGLLLDKKA